MNTKQNNKEKGFTIIEVVLVLAIAGLIFLMVFIALPALQRNQRDTQRRTDLSRVQTAIQSYQTNNRNALPTSTTWNTTFKASYLTVGGDTFADPNGTAYSLVTSAMPATPTFTASPRNIYVSTNAVCNGESITTGQGARKVAVRMILEGGGVACVSN